MSLKAARADAFLDRLAELDMALAEKVHAKAMAAEDPDEVIALSRACQRIARSVRQTLGLQAKLTLDRERSAREERGWQPDPVALAATAAPKLASIRRRAAEVRAAVEPAFRAEYEGEALEDLLTELDAYLAEISLDRDFLSDSVARIVADISAAFGLKATVAASPAAAPASDPPGSARVPPILSSA